MSSKKESTLDSLLHSRARVGDSVGVKHVLDSGRVDPDCRDKDGTTPLMLAASGGKYKVVKILLSEGADPNLRKLSGVTALFLASSGGHTDIVALLVQAGGHPDPRSQEGGTPLMAAAQAGHVLTVRTLLEVAGANPGLSMWDGAGPLFLAAQNNHHNIVSLLLTQPRINVDQQRRDGATPLWISSQMGHNTCVRLLLQHGASVDLARQDGATPLFKACHKGHEEVVKEILKYNPRLGNLQNGWTCLHAAALSGHSNLVIHLLKAGADPNMTNLSGSTPLDVALGAARKTLYSLTSLTNGRTSLSDVGSGDTMIKHWSPERLSALRSGARIMIRSGFTQRPYTPTLTSCQVSPVRRASSRSTKLHRSSSTCPASPSSTASTPKHSSVTFNDPILYKNGGIVTKVQCRIIEAKDILSRDNSSSAVRLETRSSNTSLAASSCNSVRMGR